MEKSQSPTVEKRAWQTTRDNDEAERTLRRASTSDDWWNTSATCDEPSGVSICRSGQPALELDLLWRLQPVQLAENAWCDRTSMQKTQAEQQNLTPTASA